MRIQFRAKSSSESDPAPEEVIAPLAEPFRSALLSMYAGEPQLGTNSELQKLDAFTRIHPDQGMWLYNFCRQIRPKNTAEVGLANGFSTLFILAALHANGSGTHLAIDPGQRFFNEVGLHQAEKVGMASSFRFIPDRSFPALVDTARKGEAFEFIFIDGSHLFDNALVDFTLAALVCELNGYIVLDDMWMPAVQRAVSFVRTNRKDFLELPTPIRNIAAFKRIDRDTRKWDFHVDF